MSRTRARTFDCDVGNDALYNPVSRGWFIFLVVTLMYLKRRLLPKSSVDAHQFRHARFEVLPLSSIRLPFASTKSTRRYADVAGGPASSGASAGVKDRNGQVRALDATCFFRVDCLICLPLRCVSSISKNVPHLGGISCMLVRMHGRAVDIVSGRKVACTSPSRYILRLGSSSERQYQLLVCCVSREFAGSISRSHASGHCAFRCYLGLVSLLAHLVSVRRVGLSLA